MRLNYLKKCFQCNFILFEKYKEIINGFVLSGYVRLVICGELEVDEDILVWFFFYYLVFYLQKLKKVRIVFDCVVK